jgi:hypothetical protein
MNHANDPPTTLFTDVPPLLATAVPAFGPLHIMEDAIVEPPQPAGARRPARWPTADALLKNDEVSPNTVDLPLFFTLLYC